MTTQFIIRVPVVERDGEKLDLYDSVGLRERLSNNFWVAFTNDVHKFKKITEMVYEIVADGEMAQTILQKRQTYRSELVGIVHTLLVIIETMANDFAKYDCICPPIRTLFYELALIALVNLSVLAGIYDKIKVHEGYVDGFYYIAVYFNDNFPIEELIRNQLNKGAL